MESHRPRRVCACDCAPACPRVLACCVHVCLRVGVHACMLGARGKKGQIRVLQTLEVPIPQAVDNLCITPDTPKSSLLRAHG